MNRADYMAALRRALSVLPEEERANALRYYEEYFDDAGPENEAKAIEELGEPAKVAAQILADYRELTAVPHAQPIKEKRRWRGISPLLLIVLVLLAIPIGLPLVFGAGATVLGVLLAIVVTVLAVIFAVLLILYGIPLALICGGAVIALLSCTLWATPANALDTLGNGLAAFAAGKDYAAWLQASAAALAETMGESGTLYARTADLPLLQGKLPAGVALTADDTITLGGLRAANPATGLAADDTLEARLDAQHDWFLQNAGLEITI